MGVEFYPPSGYEEHPYGLHVELLAGDTIEERYAATVAELETAMGLMLHMGSMTTLLQRVLGVNTYADADDIALDAVDVYVAFYTDTDRPGSWPSVASDKAAIDALLAARAP